MIATLALAACLALDAPRDRIVAADLARDLPEWSSLPADTPIVFAPVPGVRRVLRLPELRRLAVRWNIASDPARELCFERPISPIAPDRLLEAMRKQLPEAPIEILESSRGPAGPIEFPLTGLRPGYWYGQVTYGNGHRYVIWAKVRVEIPITQIVAKTDLPAGQPITAASVTESVTTSPDRKGGAAPKLTDILGLVPRRPIPAGTVIQKPWLEQPRLVHQGDTVKVEVTGGALKLETEAVAQSSGALGDFISVQNRDSKRLFRARVEGRGKVSVKGTL